MQKNFLEPTYIRHVTEGKNGAAPYFDVQKFSRLHVVSEWGRGC